MPLCQTIQDTIALICCFANGKKGKDTPSLQLKDAFAFSPLHYTPFHRFVKQCVLLYFPLLP